MDRLQIAEDPEQPGLIRLSNSTGSIILHPVNMTMERSGISYGNSTSIDISILLRVPEIEYITLSKEKKPQKKYRHNHITVLPLKQSDNNTK